MSMEPKFNKPYQDYLSRKREEEQAAKPAPKSSSFSKLLIFILVVALLVAAYWFGTKQNQTAPATDNVTATSTIEQTTSSTTEETASEPEEDTVPEVESQPTPETQVAPAPVPSYTPPAPAPTPAAQPSEMTVYIHEVSGDTIAVDNIAIYEGNLAITQMVRDGLCPASETKKCNLEDGIYYRNTDPTLTWFTLASDVEVLKWTGSIEYIANIKRDSPSNTPYRITLNNYNQVIKIQEIYKK